MRNSGRGRCTGPAGTTTNLRNEANKPFIINGQSRPFASMASATDYPRLPRVATSHYPLSTDRDDHAASADERSTNQNRERGGLAELYSSYDLRQQKEKDNVDAQQFAEFPAWGVDHQSIGGEGQCSARKGKGAAHPGSAIEGRLEAGVAIGLQERGNRQKEERTAAMRNDLIEQVSHKW